MLAAVLFIRLRRVLRRITPRAVNLVDHDPGIVRELLLTRERTFKLRDGMA